MVLDFYYLPMSSPCRAVLLAAKSIGVELNLKLTNVLVGESRTPEFMEMNPQHTVPTMVETDDGFCMYESRPIIQYLVNAFGQDESLYPTEPKARFLVDHRLAFDAGTLYKRFTELYFPAMLQGTMLDPEKIELLDEALNYLEGFLGKTTYAGGDNVTIADFTLAATLASIEAVGHDFSVFPAVTQYMDKLKEELDGYAELNQEGADQMGAMFRATAGDAYVYV